MEVGCIIPVITILTSDLFPILQYCKARIYGLKCSLEKGSSSYRGEVGQVLRESLFAH